MIERDIYATEECKKEFLDFMESLGFEVTSTGGGFYALTLELNKSTNTMLFISNLNGEIPKHFRDELSAWVMHDGNEIEDWDVESAFCNTNLRVKTGNKKILLNSLKNLKKLIFDKVTPNSKRFILKN